MLNSEVPYVRYLDRSDREDVRLHQPRCANASASGLRGYVDNTLPSHCYVITMILRVRRNFFEITTFPNRAFALVVMADVVPGRRTMCYGVEVSWALPL